MSCYLWLQITIIDIDDMLSMTPNNKVLLEIFLQNSLDSTSARKIP